MFNKFGAFYDLDYGSIYSRYIVTGLGLDTVASLENNSKWQKKLFTAFWISGVVFILFLILGQSIFQRSALYQCR